MDLPAVVKEIATAVLAGDWTRYADESGDRFYYVLRESDHQSEVAEMIAFRNMLVFEKPAADVFEEWYIRAALAEAPPDHWARARAAAVASGVEPRLVDSVIAAARSDASQSRLREVLDEWLPHLLADDRLDDLLALLAAIRIERTRSGELFLSESERPALRRAFEARFLRELAERFPKVVGRACTFETLSFSNPQLREATRCYLYGFFGAAVLVSVAAVEARLKSVARVDRVDGYHGLVDAVFGAAGACGDDPATASALKDLFALRNRVAHDGVSPSAERAGEALILVRNTLERLVEPR